MDIDKKEIVKAVVGGVVAAGCFSAYVDIAGGSMQEGQKNSLMESFDSLELWKKASVGALVIGVGYIIVNEVVLKKAKK